MVTNLPLAANKFCPKRPAVDIEPSAQNSFSLVLRTLDATCELLLS